MADSQTLRRRLEAIAVLHHGLAYQDPLNHVLKAAEAIVTRQWLDAVDAEKRLRVAELAHERAVMAVER